MHKLSASSQTLSPMARRRGVRRLVLGALLPLSALALGNIDKGSTSINPLSRWKRWSRASESLRETFTDEALAQLGQRKAGLARLSTRDDWRARQRSVHAGLAHDKKRLYTDNIHRSSRAYTHRGARH